MSSWLSDPNGLPDHPVVRSAAEDACKLCHHYIGTEHLLLGVLANAGEIREVTEKHGLYYAKVFNAVREMIGEGDSEPVSQSPPKTPRARKVCKAARKFARRNSRSEVRVDDLFRAILAEEDGVPQYLFTNRFEIDLDELRSSLESLADAQ